MIDTLATARLRAAQTSISAAQTALDADPAVQAAHERFISADAALYDFQCSFLPRYVPVNQEGELARLQAAALGCTRENFETVASAYRRLGAEKIAANDAEAAALEREISSLETRLAVS